MRKHRNWNLTSAIQLIPQPEPVLRSSPQSRGRRKEGWVYRGEILPAYQWAPRQRPYPLRQSLEETPQSTLRGLQSHPPTWPCVKPHGGWALKGLFFFFTSRPSQFHFLSMRNKKICLKPGLYPGRFIRYTAIPSLNYHFIPKKTSNG